MINFDILEDPENYGLEGRAITFAMEEEEEEEEDKHPLSPGHSISQPF